MTLKRWFEATRDNVWEQSRHRQRPYTYDGIVGDLLLATTKPASTGVYTVGDGIVPPRVRKDEPRYSVEARKAGLAGSVALRFVVGIDGKPRGVQVVRSLGLGLDENAIRTVGEWQFEPGVRTGLR